jgi:pyridoxine 5'-phosphate synthase PdxJ
MILGATYHEIGVCPAVLTNPEAISLVPQRIKHRKVLLHESGLEIFRKNKIIDVMQSLQMHTPVVSIAMDTYIVWSVHVLQRCLRRIPSPSWV